MQLTLALHGTLAWRDHRSGGWKRSGAVLCGCDSKHQISTGDPLALIFLDPHSAFGRALTGAMGSQRCAPIPDRPLAPLRARVRDSWSARLDDGIAEQTVGAVIATLGGTLPAARAGSDPRVARLLRLLQREHRSGQVPLERLAGAVGVSGRWVSEIFVREIGTPIRRYVLWLHVASAIRSLAAGRSATEAAHAAGFSDAAHMTRTFHRMFATPPAAFSKRFLPSCQVVAHPSAR